MLDVTCLACEYCYDDDEGLYCKLDECIKEQIVTVGDWDYRLSPFYNEVTNGGNAP